MNCCYVDLTPLPIAKRPDSANQIDQRAPGGFASQVISPTDHVLVGVKVFWEGSPDFASLGILPDGCSFRMISSD